MKSVNYLLMALSLILFISCSKESDDLPQEEGLIGTWEAVSVVYEGKSYIIGLGDDINSTYTGVGKNLNYTITFTETDYTLRGSYDFDLTYTIDDISTTETISLNNIEETGTYEVVNDEIIINGEVFNMNTSVDYEHDKVFTKVKLNDNELSIDSEYNHTYSGEIISTGLELESFSKWKKI